VVRHQITVELGSNAN
jgi:hypothetical protein